MDVKQNSVIFPRKEYSIQTFLFHITLQYNVGKEENKREAKY